MVSNKYVVKRTSQAIFTFWAALTFTFVLLRVLPGGPMDYLRAQIRKQNPEATRQEIESMVEAYATIAPNEPLYIQYFNYLTNVLQGNLGTSMWQGAPVIDILARAMPWTVFLSLVSLVFIYIFGLLLGAVMAYREGGTLDLSATTVSIVIMSTPYYIFAILLVWWLAYLAGWFPTGGRYGSHVTPGWNIDFFISALYHATLPLFSMIASGVGGVALSMRGNSIRILGEDYLRVARLRGLPDRIISTRYVGRNALLPMYTGIMISIGSLFGGSIILEQIFIYPGVGYYMFQAVETRDYMLMMGGFLFITAGVIVGLFIADLTYGKIDPRAGSGDRESY